jgi:THO complex subunit 2
MYITFWSLGLYDIHVPKDRYDDEIKRTQLLIQQEQSKSADEPETRKKREKVIQAYQAVIAKLKSELAEQETHSLSVMKKILAEKDNLITINDWADGNRYISVEFLQSCVFPRCIHSSADAVYCAKFVALLHKVRTPYFHTLSFCDAVRCSFAYADSFRY